MQSSTDIKIVLLFGYAIGYPLAVLPPILLDPILTSHVLLPSRQYDGTYLCAIIYVVMLFLESFLLYYARSTLRMYTSIIIFILSIAISMPLFLPELPHANLLAVALIMGVLSAVTIFTWSIGRKILPKPSSIETAGVATLEYMRELSAFLRQGAFTAVALFGVLYFGAFPIVFKFNETTVSNQSDIFLLNINIGIQYGYFAVYAVIGCIRYSLITAIYTLEILKTIATRLDNEPRKKGKPARSDAVSRNRKVTTAKTKAAKSRRNTTARASGAL